MTYEAIAKALGISKAGVMQIEARALRKLRGVRGWRLREYA